MFVARVVFFRLHESPRYLVHAGRPHDAVLSLRKISEFNGDDLAINLNNVEDRRGSVLLPAEDPDLEAIGVPRPPHQLSAEDNTNVVPKPNQNYHSTGSISSSPNPADYEDALPRSSRIDDRGEAETDPFFSVPETKPSQFSNAPARPLLSSFRGPHIGMKARWNFLHRLPPWTRRPLNAWLGRLALVLSKEWRSTTLLVWWIWFAISLG